MVFGCCLYCSDRTLPELAIRSLNELRLRVIQSFVVAVLEQRESRKLEKSVPPFPYHRLTKMQQGRDLQEPCRLCALEVTWPSPNSFRNSPTLQDTLAAMHRVRTLMLKQLGACRPSGSTVSSGGPRPWHFMLRTHKQLDIPQSAFPSRS